MNTRSTTKAVLVTALALSGLPLHATTWLGNDGNYSTAGEWDTGTAPSKTTDVTINSGAATNNGNLERNALTTLSGTGVLVINGGRFLGGGIMNMSGDEAILSQSGDYFIVGNQSQGTFTQTGGSVYANVGRGFFLSDNVGQAGSTYNLLGGKLEVTNSGSGATEDLFAVHFGKGGSGDLFHIDGGDATFHAGTASRNVWISRESTFELLSGSAAFSGYENFTVGRYGSTSGTSELLVSGGSFQVTDLLHSFTLGRDNNGLVTLSGGSMEISSAIILGGSSAVMGTFNMSGGTLTAADIFMGAGAAHFDFTGGDIFLTGDRTSILDEPWFNEVAGTQAIYNEATNQTHIAVVPEPSTFAMAALPLALGMMRRRRANR